MKEGVLRVKGGLALLLFDVLFRCACKTEHYFYKRADWGGGGVWIESASVSASKVVCVCVLMFVYFVVVSVLRKEERPDKQN